MNNPKKPGNEPDPDSTDPTKDLPDHGSGNVEPIEEDREPLGGNFA